MNYLTQATVAELVSIRTGTAAITLAGTDVKAYEGKALVVVQTQGDAAVKATLQENDAQAYDDADWADVDTDNYEVEPATADATTTTWEVDISSLKRYIRVKFADASTVAATLVAVRKYPA